MSGRFFFQFGTGDEYRHSINRLRQMLGPDQDDQVEGVRFIPSSHTPNDQITLIDITSPGGQSVQLVMQSNNLYIVGFISGANFYRFQGHSEVTLQGYEDGHTRTVPFGSSYRDLEGQTGRNLADVTISISNMDNSIRYLFGWDSINNSNDGPNREHFRQLGNALQGLVVAISEGARFTRISNNIARAMDYNGPAGTIPGVFTMGGPRSRLVTTWGSISEYAGTVRYDHATTVPYAYRPGTDEQRTINREQLKEVLALALFCATQKLNRRSIFQNTNELICLPNTKPLNILVNNVYWPKELAVSVLFHSTP